MGVVSRARAKLPAAGDYLDKDNLVRDQEPMGIANVVFDEHGHSFGPRWVLTIVPWFDDQEDPHGLLTFGSNPTRNPMFEDFQAQIEENGDEPIGPVVLVKDKSQKGYRFYTLADWEEPTVTAPIPAPAAPSTRPRPQRPSVPAATTAPAATPETVPNQTITPQEPKRRPGRPRKVVEVPKVVETPVSTPVTKPAEGTAVKTPAADVVLGVGRAVCPDCHQEVTGRVLPNDQGQRFIIHSFCPALGRATTVQVLEEIG